MAETLTSQTSCDMKTPEFSCRLVTPMYVHVYVKYLCYGSHFVLVIHISDSLCM